MTTQVTVLNRGPKAVKLEVQGRDSDGHFAQVDEKILGVGQFADVYLFDTQSFQAFEVKDEE